MLPATPSLAPKKKKAVATVNNQCQKYAYDLNTNPSSLKDVPNTLLKNTSEFYLVGYSGFVGTDTLFKPHFTVRNRYQQEMASYHLNFFADESGEFNNHIYLMDMSDITSRESFFITGFVKYVSAGTPVCIGFIAEVELLTGAILQLSKIDENKSIVPYHILVNEEQGQVLVSGEEFVDQGFDPMDPSITSNITYGDPPGQGIIICCSQDDISSVQWSYWGTLMLTSGSQNVGSTFENISATPQGYCVVGKMTVEAAPNFFYTHTTRIEAFHLDFGGGILWQKSLKLNNSYVRGVAAHYSEVYDRIFILFQDYYNHTYGLFAVDPSSGTHGPVCYIFGMPGESNTSRIMSSTLDERQIIVGGMGHNLHHPGTAVFSPFFAKFEFEPGPDTFRFAFGYNFDRFNSLDDGIDFNSPKISGYFNWANHSYGMFDIDKWQSNAVGVETYLYASKDSTYNSVLLYRVNFDHCNCDMVYRDLFVFPVAIPDSPQVYLEAHDLQPVSYDSESIPLTKPATLICGNPDDPDAFSSQLPEQRSLEEPSEPELDGNKKVAVYDGLGRLLFRGTYSEFLKDIHLYNLNMQMLIIVDLETQKGRKVIYTR
ncbi:MAG: hypothetical protein KL787_04870 [Taibaiella sp.]|nr:hypothetical protein [Taibaiella sp.]